MAGTVDIAIAGGADSSSVLPIGVSKSLARAWWISTRRATSSSVSIFCAVCVWKDLLPVPPAVAEYSTGLSMGQTAEQMAKTHQISREAQDALAHRSHTLAAEAWAQGQIEWRGVHRPRALYKSPLGGTTTSAKAPIWRVTPSSNRCLTGLTAR